jgi:hypothetical protein
VVMVAVNSLKPSLNIIELLSATKNLVGLRVIEVVRCDEGP